MQTNVTTKELKDALQQGCVDTLSVKNGVYTVRREFFYTHGKTADNLAQRITGILTSRGITVQVLECGETWKPFRGGASTANSSHWWVKFTVSRAEVAAPVA